MVSSVWGRRGVAWWAAHTVLAGRCSCCQLATAVLEGRNGSSATGVYACNYCLHHAEPGCNTTKAYARCIERVRETPNWDGRVPGCCNCCQRKGYVYTGKRGGQPLGTRICEFCMRLGHKPCRKKQGHQPPEPR